MAKGEPLERSEALITSILRSAPSGLAIVKNRAFERVNDPLCAMVAFEPKELLGANISVLFADEAECERVNCEIAKQLKDRGTCCVETTWRRRDGATIDVLMNAAPLAPQNLDAGLSLGALDVTERNRHHELAYLLDKSALSMRLAAGTAHEFRNLVAGIVQSNQVVGNRLISDLPGNLNAAKECDAEFQTIRSYVEKREIPRMLEAIDESGKRAVQIVEQTHRFSQTENDTPAQYNLIDLLNETLNLAAYDYELKKNAYFNKAEILRELRASASTISCVRSDFEQVMLNLLRRSAQSFTAAVTASPKISIRVREESNTVLIEIEDNGLSFSESLRSRISKPLFAIEKVDIGIELALWVSSFIVAHKLSGKMDAVGAVGNGVNVKIWLPLT